MFDVLLIQNDISNDGNFKQSITLLHTLASDSLQIVGICSYFPTNKLFGL